MTGMPTMPAKATNAAEAAVPEFEPTIQTVSGHYFDFVRPDLSRIEIVDIAHGLSQTCRFAGQARRFYSVAQHSVLVSLIVPPEDGFAGLMHDAAEAYIGDMTKPLKRLLPDYGVVEKRAEAAVFGRFGLPAILPASVKAGDVIMLATEQRDLMPPHQGGWPTLHGVVPLALKVRPVWCRIAKAMFLARFDELTAGNAGQAKPRPWTIWSFLGRVYLRRLKKALQ